MIVKTSNPWSPTYWRDVECCMQFSGWDFKGHIGLDIDGGPNKGLYRVRAQGKFQQCFQLRSARLSKQSMSGPPACTTSLGRGGGARPATPGYARAISSLFAPSTRMRRQTARTASASWSRAKTLTAIGPSGIEGVASRS